MLRVELEGDAIALIVDDANQLFAVVSDEQGREVTVTVPLILAFAGAVGPSMFGQEP